MLNYFQAPGDVEELFNVRVTADTALAILVESPDYTGWIPRSVIEKGDSYEEGDVVDAIAVKCWWHEKNVR
jgi:hypothetical protein